MGVMTVSLLLVSNDQGRVQVADYSGKRVCYHGK